MIAKDIFFAGKIACTLIVALFANNDLSGSYLLSPFNFQHFSLQNIKVTIDGETAGGTPMVCDFTENLYMRAYDSIFHALNKSYKNTGIDISYVDFAHGNTLFCFDLTADGYGNSDAHWDVAKNGNVRVKIQFAQNLTATVNVLVYGEFESIIEITKNREVLLS